MTPATPDTVTVIFQPMDRDVQVPSGTSVLDTIRRAGILFESICGGKGECGKCRVIHLRGSCTRSVTGDTCSLTPAEIADSYCLACRTYVTGDCEFTIPVESRIDAPKILFGSRGIPPELCPVVAKYLTSENEHAVPSYGTRSITLEGYTGPRPGMSGEQRDRILGSPSPHTVTVSTATGYPEVIAVEDGNTTLQIPGIAIDLGTTTVVGTLVNLADGSILGSASTLNRQITYGEELITRIAVGRDPAGLRKLREAATGSINAVIGSLAGQAGIPQASVLDVSIAGNTVMQYLLLGKDPHTLELVNADVPRAPATFPSTELGIAVNPRARVFCLPNVSRFVGGDAVGDVLISSMSTSPDLSLMIDLGTNGEIVFGNHEWLASASCASGPAFEGAGIVSGIRAMRGAIEHVTIDPETGGVTITTIGGGKPKGICGSGIIDAAAGMAGAGIIDFTGKLQEKAPGVRRGEDGLEYLLVPRDQTSTHRDIVITAQDMAYLMDSKAAACGAIGVLMRKYRITVDDVRHVYLAGAFGAYMDQKKVVEFGIIPDFPNARFHPLGNGSLAGALATLLSRKKRDESVTIAKKMVYIDLLADSDFIDEYSAAIYIPGRPEYFPAFREPGTGL